MAAEYSTHAWLGTFAGCLMRLRPDLSVGCAVQSAVNSYHHAAGLTPERAAEICDRVGAVLAPNGEHPRLHPPSSSRYRSRFG